MGLPDRIQQTIDSARDRLQKRRKPDTDPLAYGDGPDEKTGRVRRAARTAASGTKRAARGTKRAAREIAEAKRERESVGARRTVEESPAKRSQVGEVSAVYDATLDPFGGPKNPEGPQQLGQMTCIGAGDTGPIGAGLAVDAGASEGDMTEFVTGGLSFDEDDEESGLDFDSDLVGGGR